MDTRRNGECRLAYVSTSLSPGSLHSSTGGASRVCKAISRARCSAYLPQLLFPPHAPTADPANNAHYSRFWDKWGASQNFVSSPLLALISPNLLILFTK